MLFSAVSNADQQTRDELFRKLKLHFGNIFELAICNSGSQVAEYFTKYRSKIDDVFMGVEDDQDSESMLQYIISTHIKSAVANGCLNDSALDHFQYYQLDVKTESGADNIENLFLYRCLLQAVRIIALFHDVGHPPYSHIIEDVLKELYKKSQDVNCNWDSKKNKAFQQTMKKYAAKDKNDAYKCQTIYNNTSLPSSALHERIGLSLLQLAINDVNPIVFDDRETLRPQIKAIERNVPWTYIYFVPPKSCNDVEDLSKEVFNETSQAVGKSLRKRYYELFGE